MTTRNRKLAEKITKGLIVKSTPAQMALEGLAERALEIGKGSYTTKDGRVFHTKAEVVQSIMNILRF